MGTFKSNTLYKKERDTNFTIVVASGEGRKILGKGTEKTLIICKAFFYSKKI